MDWVNAVSTGNPDATAVQYAEQIIRYGELSQHSDQLAARLQSAGVSAGDVVALLLSDPLQHIIALLATLKVGGIFCSLDREQPIGRLQQQQRAMNAGYWISDDDQQAHLSVLTGQEDQIIRVSAQGLDALTGESVTLAPLSSSPDLACYLFFTSGSTGEPKPILGRMSSLVQFIQWEQDAFAINDQVRVAQLIAPSFDASLRDLFVPLCSGGVACLPVSRSSLYEPDLLLSWLESESVSVMHCTPTMYRQLLQASLTSESLPSLRTILLSGEVVLPKDVMALQALVGNRIELVNLYGPSECTMVRTCYRIPSDLPEDTQTISIGRPISGTGVLLINESGQVCGAEERGELYIRTPYMSLGYYQRPELETANFVSDPLGEYTGERFYRTGDLAHWEVDGSLTYGGRKDRQVKINGVRIELSEIESCAGQLSGVDQVAVVSWPSLDGGDQLALYYTGSLSGELVRDALSSRLSRAMMPGWIEHMEAMPLTATGKLDRNSLPAPSDHEGVEDFSAPETETEKALALLWESLLKVERVGREDNFFALGGHSLKVILLAAKIKKTLGVKIEVKDIFSISELSLLAEFIDAQVQTQSILNDLTESDKNEPSKNKKVLFKLI